MTDDLEERDVLLGRALGVIDPVPARPGFWEDLQVRLEDEQPAPVLDLARVAGARPGLTQAERRRRLGLGATAVAAAVLVVLGLVAFTGDDGQREQTTVDTVPDGVTTTVVPGPDAGPEAFVGYTAGRWVAAAAAADADTAWALLGPQSRETLGSASRLAGISGTSSLSSWGRLAGAAEDARTIVPLSEDGADQLVVYDPVDGGLPMALVVIDAGSLDTARVEAFLPGRSIGLIGISPGATVAAEDPMPVSVDADAAGFAAVFDSAPVPNGWLLRSDTPPTDLVAVEPINPMSPGAHWLALAVRTPTDAVALDVVAFQVGG